MGLGLYVSQSHFILVHILEVFGGVIMKRLSVVSEDVVLGVVEDVLVDYGGVVLLSDGGRVCLSVVPLGGGGVGMWEVLRGREVLGKYGFTVVYGIVKGWLGREMFSRGREVSYRVYGGFDDMKRGELRGVFGWYFRGKGE